MSSRRRDYLEWSRLLADRFFGPEHADLPVFLAVDDELLDEIAGAETAGGGAEELVDALRPRLRMHQPRALFEDCASDAFRWEAQDFAGPPPTIACLAVAVLAATRMASGEGIASSNYYRRLSEVLGAARIEPAAYVDVVPMLFRQLGRWLDEVQVGRLGRSSLPEHPAPAHVGYALSQALMRESDRRKLTRFFRAARLTPANAESPEPLVVALRSWPGLVALSAGARHFVGNDDYREQVAKILKAELSVWDGSEIDPEGRRIAQIHVTLSVRGEVRLGLVAERPARFPEKATFVAGSDSYALTQLSDDWYRPFPLPPAGAQDPEVVINNGMAASSGRFLLRYTPTELICLGPNSVLGEFVSRARIEAGVRHWVLASSEATDAVSRHLLNWARDGWRESSGAPQGWTLFRDVFIDFPPTETVPEGLSALIPSPAAVPVLAGGLPVRHLGATRTYLAGGEPDLWLPDWTGLDANPPAVSIDGSPVQASPVADGSSILALSHLALGSGAHTIEAAGTSLRFQIVDSCPDPGDRLWCSVVRNCATGEAGSPSDATGSTVCGPLVSGIAAESFDRSVLIPHGIDRWALIGDVPENVLIAKAPMRPRWLATADLLTRDFEVEAPFDAVWAILEWSRERIEVREVVDGRSEPILDGSIDDELRQKAVSIIDDDWDAET